MSIPIIGNVEAIIMRLQLSTLSLEFFHSAWSTIDIGQDQAENAPKAPDVALHSHFALVGLRCQICSLTSIIPCARNLWASDEWKSDVSNWGSPALYSRKTEISDLPLFSVFLVCIKNQNIVGLEVEMVASDVFEFITFKPGMQKCQGPGYITTTTKDGSLFFQV